MSDWSGAQCPVCKGTGEIGVFGYNGDRIDDEICATCDGRGHSISAAKPKLEPKKVDLRWAVKHVTEYMEGVDKPYPSSPWGATLTASKEIMRRWLDETEDDLGCRDDNNDEVTP